MVDIPRPTKWELKIAMQFKKGAPIGAMTSNNLTSEREQIEAVIRKVMVWQEWRDKGNDG